MFQAVSWKLLKLDFIFLCLQGKSKANAQSKDKNTRNPYKAKPKNILAQNKKAFANILAQNKRFPTAEQRMPNRGLRLDSSSYLIIWVGNQPFPISPRRTEQEKENQSIKKEDHKSAIPITRQGMLAGEDQCFFRSICGRIGQPYQSKKNRSTHANS